MGYERDFRVERWGPAVSCNFRGLLEWFVLEFSYMLFVIYRAFVAVYVFW